MIAVPDDWREPDLPYRARVTVEEAGRAGILVELPPAATSRWTVIAYDHDGEPLAVHPVFENDDGCWVGLDAGLAASPFWLYFGDAPSGSPAMAADDAGSPAWRVSVFRVPGVGIPDSWERMRFMRQQAGTARRHFFVDSLDSVGHEQVGERRALLEARTQLVVPQSGRYRFALRCRHAGFVLLDGHPVCEWPREEDRAEWMLGDTVDLTAGVYDLTVLNYYTRADTHRLQAGWMAVDSDALPSLIPAANRPAVLTVQPDRIEARDRRLHPGFRWRVEPAYRVRDTEPTFIPVEFTQTGAYWTDSEPLYRWSLGDGTEAEGTTVRHVYARPGRYRVRLRMEHADGEDADVEREIEVAALQMREARLGVRVTGLPVAMAPDDRLNFGLWIDGDWMGHDLDVTWRIRGRAVPDESGSVGVRPDATSTVSIPLATERRAGSLAAIEWRLSHARTRLMTGGVAVVHAPFNQWPASVAGDRLVSAAGTGLAYVTEIAPAMADGYYPGGRRTGDTVVWLSDIPGFDRSPGDVQVRRMRPWSDVPEVAGPVVKFADVLDALDDPPARLILGAGMTDYIEQVDLAIYERQLAVITDWILGRGDIELIWVTPPPLSVPPSAIRPYAAAVRRVADARRVPVIDLYSYFMGADRHGAAWRRPAPLLGLTDAGRRAVWHYMTMFDLRDGGAIVPAARERR